MFGGRPYKRQLERLLEEVSWVYLFFSSHAQASVESSQCVTGLLHNSVSSKISQIIYYFPSPMRKCEPIGLSNILPL